MSHARLSPLYRAVDGRCLISPRAGVRESSKPGGYVRVKFLGGTACSAVLAGLLVAGAGSSASADPGVPFGLPAQPTVPPTAVESVLRAQSVSAQAPTQFGGAWYDTESGSVRLGVVAGAPDPELPGVEVVPVQRSEKQLNDLLFDIYRVPGNDGLLSYADIDWANNRINAAALRVTEALSAGIREAYGDAVRLHLGPPVQSHARRNDTSPFYGGSEIGFKPNLAGFITHRCSSGFAWRTAAGLPQMVTAGHCIPRGTGSPVVGTNALPEWSYEMGRAGASSYQDGTGSVSISGSRRGDIGVINIAELRSTSGFVFHGDATTNTSLRVSGLEGGGDLPGSAYTVSGRTTGITGQWVVQSTNSSYTDSNTGDVVSPVVRGEKQNACTQPGDSGGPTYSAGTTVRARGIHSGGGGGGSDFFGGALDPCIEFFTRLVNAGPVFGGSLAIG